MLDNGATCEAGKYLLMCGGGVCSINYCILWLDVCFYVCCSDCGNVCCVTAVVEDSVLALEW